MIKPGMYSSAGQMLKKLWWILFGSAVLWFLLYLACADWQLTVNYRKYLGM